MFKMNLINKTKKLPKKVVNISKPKALEETHEHLDDVNEFFRKTESNQKMLMNKINELTSRVNTLSTNKSRVVLFNSILTVDNVNKEKVFNSFKSFHPQSYIVSKETIVETFLKEYELGSKLFVFQVFSSTLSILNEYLNNNKLDLDDCILISMSSTAPEFKVMKNDKLVTSRRNKNILRMITNDTLQISSFISLAKNYNNYQTKQNYVVYENDAYGIPFAEAFRILDPNIKVYPSDKITELIEDIHKNNKKETHLYSVTFSSGIRKLWSELLKKHQEDPKNLRHLTKIIFSETYNFKVLNEDRFT